MLLGKTDVYSAISLNKNALKNITSDMKTYQIFYVFNVGRWFQGESALNKHY